MIQIKSTSVVFALWGIVGVMVTGVRGEDECQTDRDCQLWDAEYWKDYGRWRDYSRDYVFWRDYESYGDYDDYYGRDYRSWVDYDYRMDYDAMDRCCNGKCRLICPSEVFVWILLTVFFPCALCVLCVGSITFIIYRAVKPCYIESVKRNHVSVPIPETTPPYSSYVAMSEPTKA